jgi:tRNA (cytidine/uridine-2'-O-)-methyltransferase
VQLALFEPDIPQNVGAAIRLCACLGVPLSIIEPCVFPLSDKGLRRVALDYLAHAAISRFISWRECLERREPADRLILLTTRGATPYWQIDYRASDVLMVGRESQGAPDHVHDAAAARVVVPMAPGLRSLNVVTAAAIVLSEALRQTDGFPGGRGRDG